MNDDQLILLYYGEIDDPEIARRVAQDPHLSRRLAVLSGQLEAIEAMQLPQHDADYGSRVWQRLEPRLPARRRVTFWRSLLFSPRLSVAGALAGAAALLLVAVLAFTLGRQSIPEAGQIDPSRLLAREVAVHLLQADMLLTGLANGDTSASVDQWARQLLLPNRLYRSAASHRSDPRLVALLTDVEALLLQLANANPAVVADDQMQQYIEEQLLLRVRTMRTSLINRPNQA